MTAGEAATVIGPQTGALLVRTTREGVASKVGHDLTLTFDRWSGHIVGGADDPQMRIEVTVEVTSLHILEGTGGVTALTDADKRDITGTAMRLLEADAHPQATFVSSSVTPSANGGSVEGTVTIAGRSTPLTLEVTGTGEKSWHIEASLLQSDVGIKPYRAFFGALRLADRVEISADVALGSASPS